MNKQKTINLTIKPLHWSVKELDNGVRIQGYIKNDKHFTWGESAICICTSFSIYKWIRPDGTECMLPKDENEINEMRKNFDLSRFLEIHRNDIEEKKLQAELLYRKQTEKEFTQFRRRFSEDLELNDNFRK